MYSPAIAVHVNNDPMARVAGDREARQTIAAGASIPISDVFLALPNLSPTEVLTLGMVWRETLAGRAAKLPARLVAETLGVTQHAAQGALDKLVGEGYLLRKSRGQGSPASYIVDSCRVLTAASSATCAA